MGLTIYDLQTLFTGLFALLFGVIALRGLAATLGAVNMDHEVRRRYSQRAEFIGNFFRVYAAQQAAIEERLRKEEEAREARVNNITAG